METEYGAKDDYSCIPLAMRIHDSAGLSSICN